MDDLGFGRLVRLARIRRGWRQQDLADRAGVSRSTVSRIERGHLGSLPLDVVRAVAAALDIRIDVAARTRAIDMDRVLNARHSGLASFVIAWLATFDGWDIRPEVSFSEYGERGMIDLLCWHAASRSLLVIELKTELVDFNELLGTMDRKRRLAWSIARQLGWDPTSVSTALLVADSMTNRRRAGAHAPLLRAALPDAARTLVHWLRAPREAVHALRFVSDARPGNVRNGFAGPTRVRATRTATKPRRSRST
jgi:transcriptional regulator with XRE-family HTH domain